jgi:hypothetical protein
MKGIPNGIYVFVLAVCVTTIALLLPNGKMPGHTAAARQQNRAVDGQKDYRITKIAKGPLDTTMILRGKSTNADITLVFEGHIPFNEGDTLSIGDVDLVHERDRVWLVITIEPHYGIAYPKTKAGEDQPQKGGSRESPLPIS